MKSLNTVIACLAAAIMVVAATSTALAASPQNEGASKLVLNERVDADISFTLEELADPDLMWLIELVPEEWLDDIDPTAEVRVSLDGNVHVNAMVTERAEGLWVKVHLAWHGTIMVSMDGMPELTFDLKNAQLMAQGYLSDVGELPDELKVNFHVNGALSGGEDIEMDIGTHILLKVQGGELTQLKVWLPQVACLAQA